MARLTKAQKAEKAAAVFNELRPVLVRQMAVQLCQFANGRCTCKYGKKPLCVIVEREAESLLVLARSV